VGDYSGSLEIEETGLGMADVVRPNVGIDCLKLE